MQAMNNSGKANRYPQRKCQVQLFNKQLIKRDAARIL